MFLHCECGWSQDDFWSIEYSPLDNPCFNSLKKELLQGKIYLLVDKPHPLIGNITVLHDENGFYVDSREYVAVQLERIARNIKGMAVPTIEDWEDIKENFRCPKCGKNSAIYLD